MKFNYFKVTPLELFESYPNFELFLKREDRTFAGFGVKLKKLYGLIQFLERGQVKDVLLYGNPHSNFLATFSVILKLEGFTVHSIFYTNDQNLISVNSILSKRFSNTIIYAKSKSNREFYLSEFKKGFPDGFVIPEFGIHESGLKGLYSLWRDVDSSENFDYLFLDIGTGFTVLSALEYFKDKDLQIIGVAIGNKVDKIRYDLATNAEKLGLNSKILSRLKILEPVTSPAFASKNKFLEDWIRSVWLEKQIPLEPVYSGKTLLTVTEYIQKQKLKGRGIYLHQGGLLNHLKYFESVR
jgi:1-aminocyclopropane-1-carboxylate deaminase